MELSRWIPLWTVLTVRLCNIVPPQGLTEISKTTCFSTKWLQASSFLSTTLPPFSYFCWRLLSFSEEVRHTAPFTALKVHLNSNSFLMDQYLQHLTPPVGHLGLSERISICPQWQYPSSVWTPPPEPSTISGFTSHFWICLPTNFDLKNLPLDRENPPKRQIEKLLLVWS